MFVIGQSGISKVQSVDVEAGKYYYFGHSSSPALVYIVTVTDRHISWIGSEHLYRENPRAAKDQAWIVKDMIAKGTATTKNKIAQLEKSSEPYLKAWIDGAKKIVETGQCDDPDHDKKIKALVSRL